MNSLHSLVEGLARMPVVLGTFSRGVLGAVANFFAAIANWLWITYRNIETSIIEVFVSSILSIWVLRQLWGLIAIGLVMAYFEWWKTLVAYVLFMAVMIVQAITNKGPDDEYHAAAEQQPFRDRLTSMFRIALRSALALASLFVLVQLSHRSAAQGPDGGTGALDNAPRRTLAVQAPQHEPNTIGAPSSRTSQTRNRILLPITIDEVVRSEEDGVLAVLTTARTESPAVIAAAASRAGRGFNFSARRVERHRKEARSLNESAKRTFESAPTIAYHLQKKAMDADQLDVEVAGNLAIYALRAGKPEQARQLALYALALPRRAGTSGRTTDWTTLAAAYATLGDLAQARNALFVTLAIAPDVAKRCHAAVQAVQNTYGDVLKGATIAMFLRIREQALSDAPECALPIDWSSTR